MRAYIIIKTVVFLLRVNNLFVAKITQLRCFTQHIMLADISRHMLTLLSALSI